MISVGFLYYLKNLILTNLLLKIIVIRGDKRLVEDGEFQIHNNKHFSIGIKTVKGFLKDDYECIATNPKNH